VRAFEDAGLTVTAHSPWWRSAAWPDPSEPPFLNAVLLVRTDLNPAETLAALHAIERRFGRELAARPKQGFDAPIDRWLRGELRDLAGDSLSGLDGVVDVAAARRVLDRHAAGAIGTGQPLYALLMLSLWRAGLRQPQWTTAT